MRIRWTPAAAADLDQIKDYLIERHPDLAQLTVVKLDPEESATRENWCLHPCPTSSPTA
jgi:plasmid stabilization system protein ParE